MRRNLSVILSVFAFQALGASSALSMGLWETNALLPAGKSATSLQLQMRSVGSRLNGQGQSEVLGYSSRQIQRRAGIEETRDYKMRLEYLGWTPTWAYGLMSDWTILARVSITHLKSSLNQTVTSPSGQLQSATSEFNSHSMGKAPETEGKYDSTRMGQVELRSRHRIGKSHLLGSKWTVTETLRFPTGEITNMDFIAYPEAPAEGFGAGAGVSGTWLLLPRLQLNLLADYLHNFSDKVTARDRQGFPTSEKITRQPGDVAKGRLGVAVKPASSFILSSGYEIENRGPSEYQDSSVALQPSQASQSESAYVGVKYVTADNRFATELEWAPLLAGKNTEDADNVTVELKLNY